MVLMRRRDKRRGNASHELEVASDASIVANKGLRSLRTAPTGRFAADMRVNAGGYGRADKTWGVDHPWHQTREDLFETLCAKDHMEEGVLLKEQVKATAKGVSRAALKRMKKKLKRNAQEPSTLTPDAATPPSANESTTANAKKQQVEPSKDERATKKQNKKQPAAEAVKQQTKSLTTAPKPKPKPKSEPKTNTKQAEARAKDKHKAVKLEQNPAKAGKKRTREDKAEKKPASPEQQVLSAELDAKEKAADAARVQDQNEKVARQYEESYGSEITTPSGLVLQDERLGRGKVVELGQMVTVRYRGKLGRDGMVFAKGMLSFHCGNGTVIAGWEEGISTMRSGGKRLLTIPPSLAYGVSGKGEKIPPNTTLFFEVELVRIGKRKREVIGKDDIPLPNSFNRKKKSKPKANSGASSESIAASGSGKSNNKKRRRRD